MSKKRSQAPSMIPGEEAGEKFMAVLLWAQSSSCACPACQYLRTMAGHLVKTHITEEGSGE